jgi:rhodanese-related sulfurtransferase
MEVVRSAMKFLKKYPYNLIGVFTLGVLVAFAAIMATPLRFLPIVEPTIHEISPASFHELYAAHPDSYVFIDVRTHADYIAGHAEGSVNMPLETLYNQRRYLPKHGKTVVLICNGAQASGVAYGYLEHYGFLNLMRVTGGVPAWKAAGLPIVTGESQFRVSTTTNPVSYGTAVVPCS